MIGYLTPDRALIAAFAQPRTVRRSRSEAQTVSRMFRAAPKLSELLPAEETLAVKGAADRPVAGVTADSRRVTPGSVFFAMPGRRTHGLHHLDEATMRGAVAVVAEQLPAVLPARVTFVRVADVRRALAAAARRFHRRPDRELAPVAVAGAYGKTSTAHLLKHLLGGDRRVGLLGSIHYDLGARTVPSFRTTPEAPDLFGMLAQMRDAGCRQAVVETSAAGLAEQRVRGVEWAAAVLLASGGAADGWEATRELCEGAAGPVPPVAVVPLDDPRGAELAARLAARATPPRVVTYGTGAAAQVRAETVRTDGERETLRLVWPGGETTLERPRGVPGSNLLAAAATAWALGRDPQVVLARLRSFPGVPGRMERIEAGQPFTVTVDGARSPAAVRRALAALRATTSGRVLAVIGAEGGGAAAERAELMAAVQAGADLAVVTADNPRHETAARIHADLAAGIAAPERVWRIDDRRRAIGLALELARPGDAVLIAGKGHEGYQELGDTVIPFDDRQVAREWLARREARTAAHA